MRRASVDIDTGAVLFSADLLADLYTLVDTPAKFAAFVNDRARLSFYGDFLYPLASRSTFGAVLPRKAGWLVH